MSAQSAGAQPQNPQEAYRAALEVHQLTFQCCTSCGYKWLPPRTECQQCWSDDYEWIEASGIATVVSWVNFHLAFDPRFKDRTPYNVALVELDEGPRMITNLIKIPATSEVIGRRVTLLFEEDLGRQLPRFQLIRE